KVKVTVMEVDVSRKRIALSLKSDPFGANPSAKDKSEAYSPRSKPQVIKEESMEDKLAQLKNKFKR
ncbi:MAG TPA: hypothetical protein VGQ59_19015, partial [Cyclobacteriaceae bacterium]|nr:hypothetical protein [Cyclobacteriaceae bacterium]